MLKHLGEDKKAEILKHAVLKTIKKGVDVTYDLKPDRDDPSAAGTKQMAEAIVKEINK